MISGFTFVKNAINLDYPVVEAIKSILPLCDEVVVAVGDSEDNTLELVKSIHPTKVRIIETIWDESLREGGRVLAEETNKALAALDPATTWAIYIQGDEVLPESAYPELKSKMKLYADDPQVEGLLLKYRHFYGSYDYVASSRDWYRNEIRVVRPAIGLSSYKDAQGFRLNDRKLQVKAVNAYIHHYGWVKHPETQQAKQRSFNKLWHDDEWVQKKVGNETSFDYSAIDFLEKFEGEHPELMKERISKMNWTFDFDPTKKRLSMKKRFLSFLERKTGHRFGEYRNYRVV